MKGQRVYSRAPFGHWKTSTFVAALTDRELVAPLVIDGPMNSITFLYYVTHILAQELSPGDVVIMDNLSCHKAKGVKEAIEAAGAMLLYLPPYSPDLNPIEMIFAKLKTLLRKAAKRTVSALWEQLTPCLKQFLPQECRNCFNHAGYVRL